MTYIEKLVGILDLQEQILRSKLIPSGKVSWQRNSIEETTWEPEDKIQEKYPHLFVR